jgi:outer membrane protein assembly factor BamB
MLNRSRFFFALLALILSGPSDHGWSQQLPATPTGFVADRPFRLGLLQLSEESNREKTLGVSSSAGWAVAGGLLIGAWDKKWVGAKNLATGRVAWWFEGESDLTAPVSVVGSWVMLGFRSGRLVKVEVATGRKVWETSLDSFTERSVLLNGANLLVYTAGQVLYSIDFQTGKPNWLFDAGFPEGLTIRGGVVPVVHDNRVLLGTASGEIVAVDQQTGKSLWRYNPAFNDSKFHDLVGELVVRNNQLLVTRYDGLVASVDLASSERRLVWQNQLPSSATSAFRNGRYYVGTVSGVLHAFDASTGREVWQTVTGTSVGHIVAGEAVVYAVGSNGRLSAIDTVSGSILWHDDVAGEVASAPFVHDVALHVATGLRNIYSWKLY